jgi:hypothetical protein
MTWKKSGNAEKTESPERKRGKGMTVKELMAKLEEQDPDRIVVLSIDPEGNGFSPLYSVETYMFDSGEIGLEELTDELAEKGYSDDDVMDHGKKAVVLWP